MRRAPPRQPLLSLAAAAVGVDVLLLGRTWPLLVLRRRLHRSLAAPAAAAAAAAAAAVAVRLLNSGAAGVYFNDSSKIVLLPHSRRFVYLERCRSKSSSSGSSGSDSHMKRVTHTLDVYPEELKKKVTLLKHFQNYLLEQAGRSGSSSSSSSDGSGSSGGVGFDPDAAADAAAAYGDDVDVHVKKWLRTRHAILFRLSNRTVQVCFFDHSEILLAGNARVVMYVDKEKRRSTQSLAAVTETPHAGIAKRLKYTKDILYQLIKGARR
eukprot:PLAT4988.3.p1 GENE.PLAT4988.3~~PLAT4988.3.p1  ORF type:complete len:266 (-),score=148.63 PLAT4988.3:334-1131(-)